MIGSGRFTIEPWHVREIGLDMGALAQAESIFALSNGHIGVRGTFDEGDPSGLPGTYLNSFYEERPLPYAEAGYGFPEVGQTVVNVTDGKLIRMLVDDEPFDLRYGTLLHHERILDLRGGFLHRVVEWRSPSGAVVRVRSTRLVSLTQRAIMGVKYEVEAVGQPMRISLQSELIANEELPRLSGDPRVAAMLKEPLQPEYATSGGLRATLIHTTRQSGLRMAASMDHLIDGPSHRFTEIVNEDNWARLTSGARLQAGQKLTLTKIVAYGWSSQRSRHALQDQVNAAVGAAMLDGWDGLVSEQREVLDNYWQGADVVVEGDTAIQQAVRFSMFHVLQAGARAENRAILAKGLTGPGYDGHAFWDTELFVLPVLTATYPDAAHDALTWRHSTLDMARDRAHTLHFRGAAFPWRTIRGQECSGYWPAGTAALHINADIAAAAVRYMEWTGDDEFAEQIGLELLVETARLWMSVGFHGADGEFHINGVTGPDEYSAIVEDNTYTNVMARMNLLCAAGEAERWPKKAAQFDVAAEEIDSWRAAANAMSIPYNHELQIPEQDRGSTAREVWDFVKTAVDNGYPLLLNYPYFDIYRKQVVKQADLMLAMHWCGDRFSHEDKARAFAYYDRLTVRDSSLSACTQSVIAAEVGHLDLAHEYLSEAAFMDIRDLEHNTRDGLHIASLAGTWIALVAGFGGMRDHGGILQFAPQLPPHMTKLGFALQRRGSTVRVQIEQGQVTYRVDNAPPDGFALQHGDERIVLHDAQPVTRPTVRVEPMTPRPDQPAGRETTPDTDES